MLDFENGDLAPQELPSLFPDLQMVVTNSFRHTATNPRFRVVFFTNKRMTPAVYEAIFDAVVIKLLDAGYSADRRSKKRSGLDTSKRTAASLFYVPSQAERPVDSFFWHFGDDDRQVLDPEIWVKNMRLRDGAEPIAVDGEPQSPLLAKSSVKGAISRWRNAVPGTGNDAFFLLALNLKAAGLMYGEILSCLKQEALHGRSPTERQAQIPSIMKAIANRNCANSSL